MIDYGHLIKNAREELNLTQEQLGESIGVTGVTIMRYEKGQRQPSSKIIEKIAGVLGSAFVEPLLEGMEESIRNQVERKKRIDSELSEKLSMVFQESDRRSEEAYKAKAEAFVSSEIGRAIIVNFYALNEYGKEEARNRIVELTWVPEFMDEVPEELEDYAAETIHRRYPAGRHKPSRSATHNQGEGVTHTQAEEKPPEGNGQPPDGK